MELVVTPKEKNQITQSHRKTDEQVQTRHTRRRQNTREGSYDTRRTHNCQARGTGKKVTVSTQYIVLVNIIFLEETRKTRRKREIRLAEQRAVLSWDTPVTFKEARGTTFHSTAFFIFFMFRMHTTKNARTLQCARRVSIEITPWLMTAADVPAGRERTEEYGTGDFVLFVGDRDQAIRFCVETSTSPLCLVLENTKIWLGPTTLVLQEFCGSFRTNSCNL